MEQAHAAKNRSPWPACADCQVEDPAADDSRSEAPSPQHTPHEQDDDALFGDIDRCRRLIQKWKPVSLQHSSDLGLATGPVRRLEGPKAVLQPRGW
jgi:hypothetical protein